MVSERVAIIFHGIGTPGPAVPEGERRYWISPARYAAVLDRILALPDPRAVRITFDDGNISDLSIGLPGLVQRGLTADFFVLTGRLGQPGSLAAEDVRALRAAGMRIGSHGIDHRPWPTLDPETLWAELSGSRLRLTAICGGPVTEAGIPFGSYDARVLRDLRRAGYVRAWSSDGGRIGGDGFLLPRASITADMDDAALDAVLAGEMAPLRRLRRSLGMLRKQMSGRLSA
ncbi:MAG: polysaccharide deacetylase family protein [Rhodobacteraceae bacterium]|nr:polysaccharide deacetylase family protein [Paracoccaceae bacterium]